MLPVLTTDTVTTDLERAIHYTLMWGLEGVVLRVVGKAGDRVPYVNEVQLHARLEDAELPIVAIDPGLFECGVNQKSKWMNDLLLLEDVVAFCSRIGCLTIRVGNLASADQRYDAAAVSEVFAKAGALAQRAGITLAVRNDAGTACATGTSLSSVLQATKNPVVCADWRPANATDAGEAPDSGLDALINAGCNIAMVTLRGDSITAAGEVNLRTHAALLKSSGYTGPVCLEVVGDAPGTVGLGQAVALISAIQGVESTSSNPTADSDT